jgi:hypothetical protein
MLQMKEELMLSENKLKTLQACKLFLLAKQSKNKFLVLLVEF